MVLKPWINNGISTIAGDRRIFSINRISKSVGLCVFKTSTAMGNCNGGLWHCCTEGELEPWRGSGGKVRCSERGWFFVGVVGEVESKMQIVGLVIGGDWINGVFFWIFSPHTWKKQHLLEKVSLKFEEYLLWSRQNSKLAIQRFQKLQMEKKNRFNQKNWKFLWTAKLVDQRFKVSIIWQGQTIHLSFWIRAWQVHWTSCTLVRLRVNSWMTFQYQKYLGEWFVSGSFSLLFLTYQGQGWWNITFHMSFAVFAAVYAGHNCYITSPPKDTNYSWTLLGEICR